MSFTSKGCGKGKKASRKTKNVNSFLKHIKMQNRPALNEINGLVGKNNRHRLRTNDHRRLTNFTELTLDGAPVSLRHQMCCVLS